MGNMLSLHARLPASGARQGVLPNRFSTRDLRARGLRVRVE